MIPALADTTTAGNTDLIAYLVSAIITMAAAIGVLFWQFVASKNETIALAKELIPVASAMNAIATALKKVVDRTGGGA